MAAGDCTVLPDPVATELDDGTAEDLGAEFEAEVDVIVTAGGGSREVGGRPADDEDTTGVLGCGLGTGESEGELADEEGAPADEEGTFEALGCAIEVAAVEGRPAGDEGATGALDCGLEAGVVDVWVDEAFEIDAGGGGTVV